MQITCEAKEFKTSMWPVMSTEVQKLMTSLLSVDLKRSHDAFGVFSVNLVFDITFCGCEASADVYSLHP